MKSHPTYLVIAWNTYQSTWEIATWGNLYSSCERFKKKILDGKIYPEDGHWENPHICKVEKE